MKKLITALLFCLAIETVSILGQSPLYIPKSDPSPEADRLRQDPGNSEARRRYEIEQRREQQRLESGRNSNGMMTNPVVSNIRAEKITKTEAEEKAKSIKESMKMLEPPAIYYDKHRNFLAANNTGIARIFPDKNCVFDKVISVSDADRCINVPVQIPKNGSLYSFTLGKNYIDYNAKQSKKVNSQGWWDIHFVEQDFVAGNCCTQGIIANLGDVAIDNLNANSLALSYLINFKAKETIEEIQQHNQVLNQAVKSNEYIYQKKSAVQANNTYAVRSIFYDVEKNKDAKKDHQLKVLSDTITIFRVVSINDDKSLIIIWKRLLIKNS